MAQWFVSTGGSDSTGTGTSGNPYATPGKAGSVHSSGDTIFVATGTYTTTSASANVAGGIVSLTAGTTAATTRLIGTDGSFNPLPLNSATSQPKLVIGTGSSITGVAIAANCDAENFTVDGNNATSIKGFSVASNGRAYNCQAKNCKNSAFFGSGTSLCIACYATTCSTTYVFTSGFFIGCIASANTFTGFAGGANCFNCLSLNNSGASTDGFAANFGSLLCVNCVAYGNGRHGFIFSAAANLCAHCINCYAEANGVGTATNYGFTASAAFDNLFLANCAATGNGTSSSNNYNTSNITAGNVTNFQALASTGVVNASGGNFLPLPASALVANGLFGAFPVISSTGFQDIGAVQSDYRGGTNQPIIVRGQIFPVY